LNVIDACETTAFKVFFIFGNKNKSHGAISGEYGGWGKTTVLFLAKKLRNSAVLE
jgi:hypothetical protein